MRNFVFSWSCGVTKILRQGTVIPMEPVLRSMTRITIESNNQGSRKVTIKWSRVLCSHCQMTKSILAQLRSVYISARQYKKKNVQADVLMYMESSSISPFWLRISVHASTPLVSVHFDYGRSSKHMQPIIIGVTAPWNVSVINKYLYYVPKPYSSMPLSSSWQPLLCCFR